jgi:DNA-binding LacI/PurR family transcriptional regulator/DNA-binding transcriptional regulator YhcF (GntR family)
MIGSMPLRPHAKSRLPDELVSTLPRGATALVVEGVAGLISKGALGIGTMLPSERLLAEHFKVNRKAVSRALTLLIDNGVVKSIGPRARTVTPEAVEMLAGSRNRETKAPPLAFMQKCMVVLTPEPMESRGGFILAVSSGVVAGVRKAGFDAIYVHPNKIASGLIDPSVTELLRANPAGVLLPDFGGNVMSRELLACCRQFNIPVVTGGGSPEYADCDRVLSDHEAGAYAVTKWLIAKGRRRILQCAPYADQYWFAGRRKGYERAINEAGLELLPVEPIPPRIIGNVDPSESDLADVARHMSGYLVHHLMSTTPVDAIVAHSDGPAHQLIAGCQWLGKQVHRDVTVVGYDNYWADMPERMRRPPAVAATVDKQNFEAGLEMVKLLLQRMNGELPGEPQVRVIEPKLVVVER